MTTEDSDRDWKAKQRRTYEEHIQRFPNDFAAKNDLAYIRLEAEQMGIKPAMTDPTPTAGTQEQSGISGERVNWPFDDDEQRTVRGNTPQQVAEIVERARQSARTKMRKGISMTTDQTPTAGPQGEVEMALDALDAAVIVLMKTPHDEQTGKQRGDYREARMKVIAASEQRGRREALEGKVCTIPLCNYCAVIRD